MLGSPLPPATANQTNLDPSLTRLLSSNQSPTCFERLQIESRIRSSDGTLAELDEQILKVRLVLRELESRREGTSTLRTSLQAVLSPLRRFPVEILAEIFLFCRNNSLASGRHSTIDPRQAPLVLGQICSRWREVSQDTSHLWDQIQHIQGAIPPMRDVSGHLETFATRAQNRPLSLVIDTQSYDRLATSVRVGPLDLVLPLCLQLQRIHLTLNWNECQSSGLPVDTTFPVLTSLFIDIRNSFQLPQSELIRLIRSFRTMPTLQSLTFHAPYGSGDPLLSMVPWSQLTSLDLRVEMTVVTAQQIVLQAQLLQTLVIMGIRFSAAVPTILPVRVLPKMRSIKFSTPDIETAAAFFRPFSFPNLKSFNFDAPAESQLLLDIRAQSGFQLEELELSNIEVDDGVSTFFRLLSSLIHLSLNECTNDLFTLFTCNPSSAVPPISLPLLQTLQLKQSTDSLDGDIVVGMVESLSTPIEDRPACHPFPRLTGIHVWLVGSQFHSAVESRLATLSATGFLHDNSQRFDPSDSDDSDSSSDWYVSLRELQVHANILGGRAQPIEHLFLNHPPLSTYDISSSLPTFPHSYHCAHSMWSPRSLRYIFPLTFLVNYLRLSLYLLRHTRLVRLFPGLQIPGPQYFIALASSSVCHPLFDIFCGRDTPCPKRFNLAAPAGELHTPFKLQHHDSIAVWTASAQAVADVFILQDLSFDWGSSH